MRFFYVVAISLAAIWLPASLGARAADAPPPVATPPVATCAPVTVVAPACAPAPGKPAVKKRRLVVKTGSPMRIGRASAGLVIKRRPVGLSARGPGGLAWGLTPGIGQVGSAGLGYYSVDHCFVEPPAVLLDPDYRGPRFVNICVIEFR